MKNILCVLVFIILCCMNCFCFGANKVSKTNLSNHKQIAIPQIGQFNKTDFRDANPPSDVTISVNAGIVTLSWSAVFNAASYKVEASNTNNRGFTDVTTSGTFNIQTGIISWSKSVTEDYAFFRIRSFTSPIPSNFVLVQRGTFFNGTSDVTISSFYMNKYEITQSEFMAVMGMNPSSYYGIYGIGDDFPVYNITWANAIVYCNKRSISEGLTPCYSYTEPYDGTNYGSNPTSWPTDWYLEVWIPETPPIPSYSYQKSWGLACNWEANGYRLPTEMEWMFAARGGNLSHDYFYSGGNEIDSVAWWGGTNFGGNSSDSIHVVGTKSPNELGLYDLSGNVNEWCWDMYDIYPAGAQVNPHGPTLQNTRVFRGGCCESAASNCLVSYRNDNSIDGNVSEIGFRICLNDPNTVLPPTFSPVTGTYLIPQNVSITSNTFGATIRYTIDGSTPSTTTGMIYSSPILVDHTLSIKAIAYKSGYTTSEITSALYTINLTVTKPTFSPPGGQYSSSQSVSIICPITGAQIRYTTDGSNPTESSSLYQNPISVNQFTTIKAKAYKTGWTASQISTAVYTFSSDFALVTGGIYNTGLGTITVPSFYVEKHEITKDEYEAIMFYSSSVFTGVLNGPVNNVTWFNAIEYCNRRSIQEGLTPCYSFNNGTDYGTNPSYWPLDWNQEWYEEGYSEVRNYSMYVLCNWNASGYRLPSTSEWVFASRGGNLTHNYSFSGSNTIGDVSWYLTNSINTTHSVGLKTANELGIFDMSGNVWEWCWDAYFDEMNMTPSMGESHYLEGGSWNSESYNMYSSWDNALSYNNYSGFRIYRRDPNMVAIPSFSPAGGAYSSTQTVSISCTIPGVQIRYTTNGTEPTESSSLYNSALTISQTTILKARAFKSGFTPSEIKAAGYVIGSPSSQMVTVTGGTFNNGFEDVTISTFMMNKYEVSQASFLAVMGYNPSYCYGVSANYPVYYITWFNAIEYCNKRSITEGLTPCYRFNNGTDYGTDPNNWPSSWTAMWNMPGMWFPNNNSTSIFYNSLANGYRLPSRSEWMFAARGGNLTHNYTYSGSNTIGNVAWYSTNSSSAVHQVGTKTANELALYDMTGNVSEWCSNNPDYDPLMPPWIMWEEYQYSRNIVGGSWSSPDTDCAVASQLGYSHTSYTSNSYGFRVCRFEFETVAPPVLSPVGTTYNNTQSVSISTATIGATIRYTTNGSTPSTTVGTIYSSPISVTTSQTIKAIAYKTGCITSTIASETYSLVVDVPVFSLLPGTYLSSQTTTITTNTTGASIRYTTDGSTPTSTTGTLYSSPISINSSQTVKAIAYKTGMVSSNVISSVYTVNLTVSSPTFSHASGAYTNAITVAINCSTSGSTIRYTLDGSEPTISSQQSYGSVYINATRILKAKAFKTDWTASATSTALYSFISSQSEMVYIAGGTFNNGTSNVTLSSFYIDKYECTQVDYQSVIGSNPSSQFGIGSNYPAYGMGFRGAIEYCNKRSIIEGLTPCYSYSTYGTATSSWPYNWCYEANHVNLSCNWTANGYRLPSEMEWMYAARGGSSTHNYTYSGSNDVTAVGWCYPYAANTTHTVGSKNSNELGLYDMTGNLSEYCWDIWSETYPSGQQTNPHGPASGTTRVVRGGNFDYEPVFSTVSYRDYSSTDAGSSNYGFRLCRTSVSIPMQQHFTRVEGGTFNNGASDVTLSPILLDKYEVTQSSYQSIMGSIPSTSYGNGSDYPVYGVSWFNAFEYCNRRSLSEGLIPCYSYRTYGTNPNTWPTGWNSSGNNFTYFTCNWEANGYRLPTEMEWMFAARGGNLTQGYTYSGSNNINTVAWYNSNSSYATHIVGSKTANELGLYDMSGNVNEWCWDSYGSYPYGPQTNPHGATDGYYQDYRILRGGGFDGSSTSCTTSYRSYNLAYYTNLYGYNYGFRICRNAPSQIVATPTFNMAAGIYNNAIDVSISCSTPGASIYYTINNSLPTESSMLYQNPVTISQTTYLRAIAFKTGWTPSEEKHESYNLTIATPTFSVAGGVYTSTQTVNLQTVTTGTEIRYTTNGSEPTETSSLYTNPLSIFQTTTLKVKAYRTGWNPSSTATAIYTINNLVLVDGGTFNNGTSNVTVSSFYLDKYELTQAAYQAVMGTNPASSYGVGSSYPVYFVSWFNAIEYCNKRSISEGLTPCYSYSTYGTNPTAWPSGWNTSDDNHTNVTCNWTVNGYRLPTEAEWEFAARGGNSTHGYTYSGSNTIDGVAWYSSNSSSISHVIGSKAANELGIYDMSGNVWEWNWDIYGTYPSGSQNNPHGVVSGSARVLRGGCWADVTGGCASSFRNHFSASSGAGTIGIRICKNVPAPPIQESYVLVDGGTFNNGTSDVALSSFYMYKTELTQSLYQTVMGTNPASGYGVGNDYPVYNVNWFKAIEYCNRRSINEGLTPCYSYSTYGGNTANWPSGWNTSNSNHTNVSCNWTADGYRLPTEMEWQFAARGGNLSHNYTYSGSNTLNSVAWNSSNAPYTTHSVGTLTANELGIYDMSGNICEWVWDIYDNYPSSTQINPHGPTSGLYHVQRGGSWGFYPENCAVSSRVVNNPTDSNYFLGFRLCRSIPAPPVLESYLPVPGGTFNNGTSDVTISSFSISNYEVTQYAYKLVMGTNPSYFSNDLNKPVDSVTWFNAIEYCNRKSISEGLTPCYTYIGYGTNPSSWPSGWNTSNANHVYISCNWAAFGYRLPTEMEWQFAARGGTLTNNYSYAGSNTIDAVAWYLTNAGNYTHQVGTKASNELSLYDMSGNVWEWNWDIYGTYSSGLQANPHGVVSGSARVVRGGSWTDVPGGCTVSGRNSLNATDIGPNIGFRICRIMPIQNALISVPGGTFNNGTSDVTISTFSMEKYETTQTAYQAVMGNNPSYRTSIANGPVEQVTWYNAIEYCNRRSISEGLTPCYSYSTYGTNPSNWPANWNAVVNITNLTCDWATANGYRLPTEMEWQFAARGGNLTHNYAYSGSNTVTTVAWCNSNSGSTTHTVGDKLPNELGLYDMSGNVMEWVWDKYASTYPSFNQFNPHGPSTGEGRIYRGGGYMISDTQCQVTLRSYDYEASWSFYMGFRVCKNNPSFVFVPGGTFNNGTSNVTVSDFKMEKWEVRQADYQAVMGTNPAYDYGVSSNHPVHYVSWFNTVEYCNKRSIQEGFTPCYSYGTYGTNPSSWPSGWNTSNDNHVNVNCNWMVNGYRLPTEAEWEFAARGSNLTHNYIYSGSNTIDNIGWYQSNSGNTSHIVATKTANELGIYDMTGNVWEWCWDIYDTYPANSQTNPHGAISGIYRINRGGAFSNVDYGCTIANRNYGSATINHNYYGFHICQNAQ